MRDSVYIFPTRDSADTKFDVGQINHALVQVIPGARVCRHAASDLYEETLGMPGLVLVEMESPELSLQILKGVRRRWPTVPLVGLIHLMAQGADMPLGTWSDDLDDFLFCPCDERELALRVRRVLRRDLTEPNRLVGPTRSFRVDSLIGESECFQAQVEKTRLFAEADAAVLLQGETGTGKELFARAIHYASARKGKAFIPINCAALPDQLFENELFGHVKGAYTNASDEQRGLVQEAAGGTLFLDEVDSLTPSAQAKLLRFVQDREYRPLGCAQARVADVRIIAASNRDLRQAVAERQFRGDLFHRLNILSLVVPPLRERVEDIPLLAAHFMRRHRRADGTRPPHLSSAALHKLLIYGWPGNVRELESTVQRAVVFSTSENIEASDIEFTGACPPYSSGEASLRAAKCSAVKDVERAYLVRMLVECHGNVTHAAKAAGKERRSFQRLLQKYGIDRHVYAQNAFQANQVRSPSNSHPRAG